MAVVCDGKGMADWCAWEELRSFRKRGIGMAMDVYSYMVALL
jgi:hypothetical protein